MRSRCILGAMASLVGCLGYPEALPPPLETDGSTTSAGETTEGQTATEPMAACGNGRVEDGEECDGTDWNGATCESLGRPPGVLSCTSCVLDTAGCVPPGMVLVPDGTFQMGSDAHQDEQPIRQVQVDAFWIDEHEVTLSEYSLCVAERACTDPIGAPWDCHWGEAGFEAHPVSCVDWYQAEAYCAWVDGGTKRLPTEAEWEKAARGTDGWIYPWGNAPAPGCGHVVMNDGGLGCDTGTTMPVGSKPRGASPHGVQDMAGNVWEWVADWHSRSYDAGDTDNPTGAPDGIDRVIRGGSWFEDQSDYFRSPNRLGYDPTNHNGAVGFRCARTPSPPS